MKDIVDMPYKMLVVLREERVKRLQEEAKQMDQEMKQQESQAIRNNITRR